MLTFQESGLTAPSRPSFSLLFCMVAATKALLIELRVPPIALLPRLAIAFICRASRFLSTPPQLAREALICK